MKDSVRKTLTHFILLVFYGYKDSYLIDCCFISEMHILQSLIADISVRYQLEGGEGVLAILPVHSDIFIVNMNILRRKVSALSSMVTDSASSSASSGAVGIPIVVTIDSSSATEVHAMISEESRAFNAEFYEHLKSMDLHLYNGSGSTSADSSCTSVSVLSFPISCAFEQCITLPFFAGWLLGYPAIYRPHANTSPVSEGVVTDNIDRFANNTNNSLSMVAVIKASITASIHLSEDNSLSTAALKSNSSSSRSRNSTSWKHAATAAASVTKPPIDIRPVKEVELMGLSIPSALLEDDSALHDLFHSAMEGVLCRLKALSTTASSSSSEEEESSGRRRRAVYVQDLQLHFNTYTLPAIVL